MATAPDNPAKSYHPAAVTRFSCQDSVMVHLLVGGDTQLKDSLTFTSSNDGLRTNATIITPTTTLSVQMVRLAALQPYSYMIAGMAIEIFKK